MNPTDPGAVPPENQPADVPAPKPWHKPQQEHEEVQNGGAEVVDLTPDGPAGLGGDPVSSAAADGFNGASAALEGAGAALDVAGGCADGCGGCSLALLVTLFAAASTAMAFFR